MPVTLVSNATNIARFADDILECCKIIYISVDGPNAEIHNEQRPGVSENFDNFKDVKSAVESHRAHAFGEYLTQTLFSNASASNPASTVQCPGY